MSVIVHSPEVFSQIYVKAIDYTFKKQCDMNYCSTFGRMTEKQIENTIRILCDLNCESYEKRYKEEPQSPKLSEFIVFRFSGKTINTFQMLKYLECIHYNIEINTIARQLTPEEKDAMNVLHKAIEEIKSRIISEMEEYRDAAWTA